MSAREQLVLIDGSGYIFRAFHALPPMTRGDGTPVNAVYGFTGMVMKLVDDLAPDHVAVVFDSARTRSNCGTSSSGGSLRLALYSA